jgi:hypothetical protein
MFTVFPARGWKWDFKRVLAEVETNEQCRILFSNWYFMTHGDCYLK